MGKVVIRKAVNDDIDEMLSHVDEFFSMSGYADLMEANLLSIKIFLHNLINEFENILLVALINDEIVGGIGAKLYPSHVNYFHKTGCELIYWVRPKYRTSQAAIKLLRAVEREAIKKGAESFCMVALESSDPIRTGNFYKKYGYKLNEHFYYKEL